MLLLKQEIIAKLPLSQESKRLFHGRGQRFPDYEDLVIDWFAPVLHVTCYRKRDDCWLEQLFSHLKQWIPKAEAIVVQNRFEKGSPSHLVFGVLPDVVYALEDGLRYKLRLGHAQNVGFFPDMREARKYVGALADGKKVLNLFSYTCSFSVAALHGGADRVDNLDMNKGALALGRINHQINGLDLRRSSFLVLELFRSFSRLRKLGPYDLVICDPPAAQGASFQGTRDWPKIVRRLPSLLSADGEIIACMSAPELGKSYLKGVFAELCPEASLEKEFTGGEDFADADADKGLCILHYRFSARHD